MSSSSPSSSPSSGIQLDERRFDVVLLGTGLTNTILAAALSKAGKKVLHIDRNDYYGASDTSLSFNDLEHTFSSAAASTAQRLPTTPTDEQCTQWRELCGADAAGYSFLPIANASPFTSFASHSPPPPPHSLPPTASPPSSTPREPSDAEASVEGLAVAAVLPAPLPPSSPRASLASQSRHFSIDLTPRLLLSRCALVELLIASNVSGYVDFKAVDASFLTPSQQEGPLRVPVSRSDVFVSELIGMHEKRRLMRLLQAIVPNHKVGAAQEERDRRELEQWAERPFADFLASRDLSPRLTAFVAYAIALLDHQQTSSQSADVAASPSRVSTREGVARMRAQLLSIGRYGPGAFLYPIYGLGELPQAFARLCAVHGGIFILRFPPAALVVSEGERRVKGVVTDGGQFIEAGSVVSEWEYVDGAGTSDDAASVSCAVCVVDGPLIDGRGESMDDLVQCVFPPHTCGNLNAVRIIQLSDAVKAAPSGCCLLHLYTPATGSAQDDLQPVLDYLTSSSPSWAPSSQRRPALVHAMFHQRHVRPSSSDQPYTNLLVPADSSPLSLLDAHVEEAATFLRAIDPELPDLITVMAAARADVEERESKEELDELNILNAVIGVDELKESHPPPTSTAVLERSDPAPSDDREQKAAPSALDESAIFDSLNDLTFE